MSTLNFSDIQGFVLSSYADKMPCASYLLLCITDAAACRLWLKSNIGYITRGTDRKKDFCLNIAFTATGFRKLGFSDDSLSSFSVAFQEGMASPVRQQILGDRGNESPDHWEWGIPDQSAVDILLLIFGKDDTEVAHQQAFFVSDQNTDGLSIIKTLSAGRQPDAKEHFGFLDGIGQPVIEGSSAEARQLSRTGHATVIKAGEFLLGYENEMKITDPLPTYNNEEFGNNGTYLVFRQLEQHVHTFRQFIVKQAKALYNTDDPLVQDKLAAKIVGRWKSGAPLAKYPEADPVPYGKFSEDNNFGYAFNDMEGLGCPVGAHIRRTNPRDALLDDAEISLNTVKRHRIIRRGRSYGDRSINPDENDYKSRGLHFICINSNIERQFEFIQQTWINNPYFGALFGETDPLTGPRNGDDLFTVPGCPVRTRVSGLDQFVTMKGGEYFFMPGMAALKTLTYNVDPS